MTASIRRLAGCLVAVAATAGASLAADPPSREQIAAWIEALGSPQFSQREAATSSLIQAGPVTLEPLRAAVGGGDLEVASRAIEIARGLLGSEDGEAAAAAEQFLDTVAGGDDMPVARLAEATLEFHAIGQAAAAREKLQSLGMKLSRGIIATGQQGLHATFDGGWQGTPADLRLLLRVPGLLVISFHGIRLDEDGIAILRRLRGVSRLELYGTGLDERQVAAVTARLQDTHVELRKGGKLGVAGHPTMAPCQITMVQPDTAADKAGLQVGDIVTKVDGRPVATFQELTDRIGTRGPGDSLEVEISRGPPAGPQELLARTIKLDAW